MLKQIPLWKDAVKRGVKVAFGTDQSHRLLVGENLVELAFMVDWLGMSPMQALVAATSRAAECVQCSDVGTLEPGKAADILIVDGDPLADIRILEYGGIDPSSPFDGASGATGISATADSGPITTTNANDLIVGANMTTGATNGAGTGFTSRVITFPDSDCAEDQIVSAVGTYRAQARLSGADWVMQAVAFKGMPSDSQPPSAPSALGATAASSSSRILRHKQGS